ncbi:MAG: hypothetical protein EXR72_22125 [Myxococcales bacterium]|nr:hypothetical protein [Myxococcales bacterium]
MPSPRTGRLRLRLRLRLRDEQEPARGPPPLVSTPRRGVVARVPRRLLVLGRAPFRNSVRSGYDGRMPEPPTPVEIQRLKKQLLKKGAEINSKLTALLNGQQVNVEGLLGGGKPGQTPIERLRRFMAIVDASLRAIRAGTYGRCVGCGAGLPYVELEQVPWIDTCPTCAAAATTTT